jgi:hypothetical protein
MQADTEDARAVAAEARRRAVVDDVRFAQLASFGVAFKDTQQLGAPTSTAMLLEAVAEPRSNTQAFGALVWRLCYDRTQHRNYPIKRAMTDDFNSWRGLLRDVVGRLLHGGQLDALEWPRRDNRLAKHDIADLTPRERLIVLEAWYVVQRHFVLTPYT